MQLIVLAAGMGTRLGPSLSGVPKCLSEVVPGTTYLSLQLRRFVSHTLEKKIVVVGYEAEQVIKAIRENGQTDFVSVHNPDYQKGNLYSLLAARPFINSDFIVFNADHYYSVETYKTMLSHRGRHVAIFCDRDRILAADDMKVAIKQGSVVQLAKNLSEYAFGYVGVTYVPHEALKAYSEACDRVAKTLGDKAFVEAALNEWVGAGQTIELVDVSGSWWTEIDTPEDLARARAVILEKDS